VGFPLRAALDIASEESIVGGQYTVVGDGGMTVAQPASRTPVVFDISRAKQGYILSVEMYATNDAGIGSIFMPYLTGGSKYSVVPGKSAEFHVSEDELVEFLKLEDAPVRIDGELKWSYSVREEYT
jgi:hypothetical protein